MSNAIHCLLEKRGARPRRLLGLGAKHRRRAPYCATRDAVCDNVGRAKARVGYDEAEIHARRANIGAEDCSLEANGLAPEAQLEATRARDWDADAGASTGRARRIDDAALQRAAEPDQANGAADAADGKLINTTSRRTDWLAMPAIRTPRKMSRLAVQRSRSLLPTMRMAERST